MPVIYEKHYPHQSLEEMMKEFEKYEKEWVSSPDYKPAPSFEEFYSEIMMNRTMILLPHKLRGANDFIKLAIKTSMIYEIDTKLIRKLTSLQTKYNGRSLS